MKGKLKDLTYGPDGERYITITVYEDVRELFGLLKDSFVNLDIKKWYKKRSLDANAYLWVLLDKLAAVLKVPKVEIYREMIKGIGGVSEAVCVQNHAVEKLCSGWEHNGLGWLTETFPSKIEGCTNVTLYYGSSTYDTKQMSDLIDHVVEECKLQGIETMTPAELERLEGYSRIR